MAPAAARFNVLERHVKRSRQRVHARPLFVISKNIRRTSGFFAGGAADLILRVKDDYDGAEPSGNSVATLALLKLGAVTGRKDFTEAAAKTLLLFARRLKKFPQAMPFMLHALDFSLQEPKRVVIAGDTNSTNFHELLRAAHSVYQPDKIVLGNTGAVEEFARTLPAKTGPVVYLCTGNSCQPPTSEVGKAREMLKRNP